MIEKFFLLGKGKKAFRVKCRYGSEVKMWPLLQISPNNSSVNVLASRAHPQVGEHLLASSPLLFKNFFSSSVVLCPVKVTIIFILVCA